MARAETNTATSAHLTFATRIVPDEPEIIKPDLPSEEECSGFLFRILGPGPPDPQAVPLPADDLTSPWNAC